MKELSQEYKDVIERCHRKEQDIKDKIESLSAKEEDFDAVKKFNDWVKERQETFGRLTDMQKQLWHLGFDIGNTIQNREIHELGGYCNAVVDCTEKYIQVIAGKTIKAWCESHKPKVNKELNVY